MGVGTLPKPARGLSAEAFFTQYVPELSAAFTRGLPPLPKPLQIGLELEGGPSFTLHFMGTDLRVEQGLPANRAVTVCATLNDWRDQVTHVLPEMLRYTEKNMQRAQVNAAHFIQGAAANLDLTRLAAQPGRIAITLTDDAGDSTTTHIILGSGKGPHVSITLTLDDVWVLLAAGGRLGALLNSRAQVTGDLQYVLRLAAAVGLRA